MRGAPLLTLAAAQGGAGAPRPNFVYVLCDDMNTVLGDEQIVPQTRALVAEQGARASNAFVSSPKCTPSRSAWLSGRYYHNLRPHGATSGRGLNTTHFFDTDALFPQLKSNGYQTGLFGKIHNNQAGWLCKPNNHTEPWTHLETECSPCGNYNPSSFVVKKDDEKGDGKTYMEDLAADDPRTRYSEAQYGNRSTAWIRKVAKNGRPFFCFVGTTGPHLPARPAPWHTAIAMELNISAPRTPNFNMHAPDHNHLLATHAVLDDAVVADIDTLMKNRWGALMSIDDLVAGIVSTLEEVGVLDNTFVLFSSDHGYHLGQFRIPIEKMLPYETDIRIPLFIRGPGIKPGTKLDHMVANVDIAPTVLDFAGIPVPPIMDGKSMKPLLTGQWGWDAPPAGDRSAGACVNASTFMPHTDIDGHDTVRPCDPAPANETDPDACEAKCAADAACDGWTHHNNGGRGSAPGWRCCIKKGFGAADIHSSSQQGITSGVKDPAAYPPCPAPGAPTPAPPPAPPAPTEVPQPHFPAGWRTRFISEFAEGGTQTYGPFPIYDEPQNQWRLLRVMNATHDFVYVEWDQKYVFDKVDFHEYYNTKDDPWQKVNLWNSTDAGTQEQLHFELEQMYVCRGTRTQASSCP